MGMHFFDGPGARITAKVMARRNRDAEHEAISTLDPQPSDTVVAIGVGAGVGVELLAARVERVVAVDPSQVMVDETIRRNRSSIESGSVQVSRTDAANLPLADGEAAGAVAVNSLQFWDPIDASLAEVARVLRPGGQLVTFTHDWAIERRFDGTPEAWAGDLAELAEPVGLVDMRTWRGEAERGGSVAITFAKSRG